MQSNIFGTIKADRFQIKYDIPITVMLFLIEYVEYAQFKILNADSIYFRALYSNI